MSRDSFPESSVDTESSILSVLCMTVAGPRILYVGRSDENSAEIKPVRGVYDKPLWIPRGMIFARDEVLLGELQKAWQEGDEVKLTNLWKQARPWSSRVATG
jgi:hypothetical protein